MKKKDLSGSAVRTALSVILLLPAVTSAAADLLRPLPAGAVALHGELGRALELSRDNWFLGDLPYQSFSRFFREGRPQFALGEMWGKFVRSGAMFYRYRADQAVRARLDEMVADILSCERENGSISCDAVADQPGNAGGDMWERKYVMLGLERYYTDVKRDPAVLASLRRQADAIIAQIGEGEGRTPLTSLGWSANHIESATLLEPFMRLYNLTDEKRYLDFASYIVSTGGAMGYDIFAQARDASVPPKDIGGVYPKAYEMLSLFEGLIEYHRATGNEGAKAAALSLFEKVREREMTIIGNGGGDQPYTPQVAGEGWDDTAFEQTNPDIRRMMETCTGVTWLKFCSQLLRLVKDVRAADAIETYAYNGLLGAMKPDGTGFSYVNLLNGPKVTNEGWGWTFDGKPVTCCNLNGPTGLAYLPFVAVMDGDEGPVINLYDDLEAESEYAYLSVSGGYPANGEVTVRIGDIKVRDFSLTLRIPSWSEVTRVRRNGVDLGFVASGEYLTLAGPWKRGDEVGLSFDFRVKTVAAPKGSHPRSEDFIAVRVGPVVLARDERIDSGFGDAVDIVTNALGFVDARPAEADGYRLAYDIPTSSGFIRMVDYASVDCWQGGRVMTWLPKAPAQERPAGFTHEMPETTNERPLAPRYEELVADFTDPFGKVRTGCYWYWMAGNISVEGVKKDLAAMAKAGIDRAQIGDIGDGGPQPGPVRTFSPTWYEAIDAAIATAAGLGIELGIFNSPGWSQSGGPWIDASKAMRRLAIYEEGMTEFEDLVTLAYPKNRVAELPFLARGEMIPAPPEGVVVREIESKRPFTAQSAEVTLAGGKLKADVTVEAEVDGAWTTCGTFAIARANPSLNVGFLPYAPSIGTFAPVRARRFRVTITPSFGDGLWSIQSISLSSEPRLAQAYEKSLAKMFETPLPLWTDYQWAAEPVEQTGTALDPDRVVILKPGDPLPKGEWRVLRLGMVPTGTTNAPAVPEATGYEVDKMSREHVAAHFDAYFAKLIERTPEQFRSALKYAVLDSYEVGGQNMTDGFISRFRAAFGYDPTPYLPAFFGYDVGSREKSNRFLWDVRRFVADEVAYSYVGGLRAASRAHGVETWLECYGHWGFPGEFLQYGGQSDGIAGEFWSNGTLGDIENRAASSCAHIYGKNLVWSESNTSGGPMFYNGPMQLKSRLDRFFAEGVNASLLHLYIHQPDERQPGINAWFGNEFNRHNTWFDHLDLYTGYLKRCNYLLRQGLYVADIAYFIGEDTPKMTGPTEPACPRGRQFDYINAEVLKETADVDEKGRIVLPHGTAYEILVLPALETMRPETLAAIERLARRGAMIIGPKPLRSPSNQNQPFADAYVRTKAEELWSNGLVRGDLTLEAALAMRGSAPDWIIDADLPIHACHRTLADGEIYFLSNQSDVRLEPFTVSLRCAGRIPERWSAATGARTELKSVTTSDGRTEVTLSLDRLESTFIVLVRPDEGVAVAGSELISDEALEGGWKLTFESDALHRGPAEPLLVERPFDLTTDETENIRHYAGRIVYETVFTAPARGEGERFVLALGEVGETAKVRINGAEAGGVCFFPYELDVTPFVREGENALEIEVETAWINRLIGDAALPEAERPTSLAVSTITPNDPLKRAGLLGPVRLMKFKVRQ